MTNCLVLALLLGVTLSCAEQRPAEDRAQATLLSSHHATDTLELQLIRQLQRLIAALAADDSAAVADLITAHFKAVDMRIPHEPTSPGSIPGEELNYWQATAGQLQRRMDRAYTAFAADPAHNTARVYALGTTHDIWTTWLHHDDGWRAETLLFITRAAARSPGVGLRPGPTSR